MELAIEMECTETSDTTLFANTMPEVELERARPGPRRSPKAAWLILWLAAAVTCDAYAQAAGPAPSAAEEDDQKQSDPKETETKQTETKQVDDEAPPVRLANVVRNHFEPSYLAYPIGLSGLDSLLFESSIVPHFFVGRSSWPIAFVLTPKIVVRMFNERSVPIKTPSYMPRVSVYAWFTRELSPGEYATYASLTLSHHSNGQKGPFLLADGSINHETGDFSTNFFELAAYGTRLKQTFFGWSQLAFVWHPGFNQDPELRGRYGLVRSYFATTLIDTEKPLDAKLSVKVGAILDDFLHTVRSPAGRALERFPVSVEYTVTVPGFDLGIYAGYYLGHDYYNIWFDRMVHAFQLGISGSVGAVSFQDD